MRQELDLGRQRTGKPLRLLIAQDVHLEVLPDRLDALPELVVLAASQRRRRPRPDRDTVELRPRRDNHTGDKRCGRVTALAARQERIEGLADGGEHLEADDVNAYAGRGGLPRRTV